MRRPMKKRTGDEADTEPNKGAGHASHAGADERAAESACGHDRRVDEEVGRGCATRIDLIQVRDVDLWELLHVDAATGDRTWETPVRHLPDGEPS